MRRLALALVCLLPSCAAPLDAPLAPPAAPALSSVALAPQPTAPEPPPADLLCPEVASQSAHCLLLDTSSIVAVGVDDGAWCEVAELSESNQTFLTPTAYQDGELLSCVDGHIRRIDVATGEVSTYPVPGCEYLTDSGGELLLLREGETPFLPLDFTLFADLDALLADEPAQEMQRVWTLNDRPWAFAADRDVAHVVGGAQRSLPFGIDEADRKEAIDLGGSWPPRGLEVLADGSILVLTTESILQHDRDGTLARIIPTPGQFSSGFACVELPAVD
ncbi:MAG: hypothetical protein KDA24_25095 [Deltaproteobacteria bacterium]|nr:hypothetical protein [Deltaproteobacteria bacterium]